MRPYDIADLPLPIQELLHAFKFSLTFHGVEQRIASNIKLNHT